MRVRFARNQAEQLVDRLGYSSAPINVHDVAHRLGLLVVAGDLGAEVSGLLVTNSSGSRICVNEQHPRKRQRFTIAHEVGHHYLRHQFEAGEHVHVDRGNVISQRGPRSSAGVDIKEIEANHFAAALLMPSKLLHQEVQAICRGGPLIDVHVEQLAEAFDVSEQAMTIRLSSLGHL